MITDFPPGRDASRDVIAARVRLKHLFESHRVHLKDLVERRTSLRTIIPPIRVVFRDKSTKKKPLHELHHRCLDATLINSAKSCTDWVAKPASPEINRQRSASFHERYVIAEYANVVRRLCLPCRERGSWATLFALEPVIFFVTDKPIHSKMDDYESRRSCSCSR